MKIHDKQAKKWRMVKFGKVELDLVSLIDKALNKTLQQDGDILRRGRSERLFASRLAYDIQKLLNDFFQEENSLRADSPYNKHFNGSKKLDDRNIEVDLAVHKRGVDDFNFLVSEIETNNNPVHDDLWKIETMTKKNGKYHYKLGLYLVVGVESKAGEIIDKKWYVNGKEVKI